MTPGSLCNSAIDAFHEIERGCGRPSAIPPIARFAVTTAFLLALVSTGKYDLPVAASLAVYPVSLVCFERAPLFSCLLRFWFVLIPVLLLGAANPFFDREIVAHTAGLSITGGWLSFAVLTLKGTLAVAVTLSFLRKTGIQGLADAMACMHLPRSFGLSVLLLHRYIVMMIKETERMKDAYSLRSAKGARAIGPSSWGPFVGQLLIRSMDRASCVQAAMELREGMSASARNPPRASGKTAAGCLYFTGWAAVFLAIRFFDPMRRLGNLILFSL
jgi:cobalt/nickel transport system permease protein